jgi:glycosyltransferase involved in cell wall biosynthesis
VGNPYADLLIKPLTFKGVQVKVEDSNFSFIFLPKIIGSGKTDILHLHTLHYFFLGKTKINRLLKFFLFISQVFIIKLLGTKLIWTVHEWTDRFGDGKNDIPPVWSGILGRLFDAVITHCDTTKKEIVKAFRLENKNKVFVIPHGNYIGSYENKISQIEARKKLDIPQKNLVFLLFGNIHRTKGFLEAIDAFKRLKEPSISLLVVGHPAEDKIEEEIRDKVKGHENILFLPQQIPDKEIQLYMNAGDCVLVPYKVFTTSGVTILTMSFGRACIAPNVGFFSDVLDESGAFLYDSTNEEGLFSAMKSAIEKRNNILEMGKHNLKLAEQWNWDSVAQLTFNIYKGCLGQEK